MDFWVLFITALMPVLKVLLLAAVGAFLALDCFDVLREDARKHLNAMVFFVFSPALVCSNLAQSITFRSMIKLWFMPLNILLTFIIGTALGWILIKIIRVPHDMQGLVLGCCSAGNLGSLVFIFILAVCKESRSPFGTAEICYKNGLAYASLSMAIGAIYLWSYVYNIVRIFSSKCSNANEYNESMVNAVSAPEIDPGNLLKCSTELLVTAEGSLETNENVNQLDIECTMPDGKQRLFIPGNTRILQVPKKEGVWEHIKALLEKLNLKVLLAPSTIGSVVGLVIGAVPPFRRALVGDSAPLRVVQDTVSILGDAAIPTIILIVGANLVKGLKKSGIQLSLIIGIIVVRYIALPIIGVGIIKGATCLGLVHSDPLYQFVLLFQFAVPPAINMGTITQLFGAGESECSVIMLATYTCASISLTLWCTFFMWLVL